MKVFIDTFVRGRELRRKDDFEEWIDERGMQNEELNWEWKIKKRSIEKVTKNEGLGKE